MKKLFFILIVSLFITKSYSQTRFQLGASAGGNIGSEFFEGRFFFGAERKISISNAINFSVLAIAYSRELSPSRTWNFDDPNNPFYTETHYDTKQLGFGGTLGFNHYFRPWIKVKTDVTLIFANQRRDKFEAKTYDINNVEVRSNEFDKNSTSSEINASIGLYFIFSLRAIEIGPGINIYPKYPLQKYTIDELPAERIDAFNSYNLPYTLMLHVNFNLGRIGVSNI